MEIILKSFKKRSYRVRGKFEVTLEKFQKSFMEAYANESLKEYPIYFGRFSKKKRCLKIIVAIFLRIPSEMFPWISSKKKMRKIFQGFLRESYPMILP